MERVERFVREQLDAVALDGASVCLLVPDATRSVPLPMPLGAVHRALRERSGKLTVLVALGTHAAMSEPALAAHLGYRAGALADRYPGTTVLNHAWWDPSAFAHVGADKYLFPGVSGRELIDVSHWLGALLGSAQIIGRRGITPVRALIEEAASMVPGERLALCVVTRSRTRDLHAVAFGAPPAAWEAAAAVSEQAHIRYLDAPVRRVLSLTPPKYEDMWTAAKGFYKVEPVVADGGEVVLYAPHVREVSRTHPEIEQLGYHCRDYFVKQWDRFSGYAWGDLAHCTHLRGAGSYDEANGERNRVMVTLATGISPVLTRAINLGYLDPLTVDPAAWAADPDTLVVPDAGEVQEDASARLLWIARDAPAPAGTVTIVSAGTADGPVVREVAACTRLFGAGVRVQEDVGVAGRHRVMLALDDLRAADCVVVVAGHDAALASVVGGLVAAPVIAVPTSTGYGVAAGGVSALLSMLSSCAPGVAVVNIDDGFGAATIAARIARAAAGAA